MCKLNAANFLPWLLAALTLAMVIAFGKIIMRESATETATATIVSPQGVDICDCGKAVSTNRRDCVVDVLGHACCKL